MPKLGKQVDRFTHSIARLAECCARVEGQYAASRLQLSDILLVYASSFLSACAKWEALIEACMFEAACGRPSTRPGNFRHVRFRSRQHLRELLLYPNRDYLPVQSVKAATEVTALLINEGRPISGISEPNRTHLQQAGWIRNAIAHESAFALRVFREKVPGVAAMLPNQRTPARFLRSEFRINPRQRRYELYFAAMSSAAREIRNSWE